MPEFLQKFYPSVYASEQSAVQDNYCKYNNQVFQLYTSSLYLAALLATFGAGTVTRKWGHRASMLMAGLFFLAGTGLGTGAENLEMLILGRIFLGIGLGFANQVLFIYIDCSMLMCVCVCYVWQSEYRMGYKA